MCYALAMYQLCNSYAEFAKNTPQKLPIIKIRKH